MPQFAQRLGFDLPDALASHGERLAYFFQGVLRAIFQAEAHLDDFFLARGQGAQHLRRLVFQIHVDDGLGGRDYAAVFDEVAQMRIFLFADGRLQRDGLLRDLQYLAHFGDRNIHPLGDLFRGRLAAELLHQLPRGADELVDGLDHVDRNADGARLVGDGTGDGLPDPPGGVSGELVAAAIFEFIHRLHQTDVAFLDQVKKLQASIGVLLGDRNHQAQVGLDELALGVFCVDFALDDLALRAPQLLIADPGVLFDLLQIGAVLPLLPAIFLLQLFAASGVVLLLQLLRLAVEHTHGVNRLAYPVDQPLALEVQEADIAHGVGDHHDLARQVPSRPPVGTGIFLFRHARELFGKLQRALVVLAQTLDAVDGVFEALGHDLFRDLFLIEDHDLLDAAHAALQVFAQRQNLADNDRRARNGLEHAQLPALDAFGDLHFTFAGEQRHRAHLAHIHAHRVVGFFQLARGEIELHLFAGLDIGLALGRRLGAAINNVNALRADGGQQVVQVLGRMYVVGNELIGLVVGEVALLLAGIDQLFNVVELVFKSQTDSSSLFVLNSFRRVRFGGSVARWLCFAPPRQKSQTHLC